MATTTNYGWTTPDDTALVKDGAAAIRTLGSSIDTSLNTALGTKKAGLVLLNTTSFSGVSSQSFNNVFSSTYDNYRIVANISAAGATTTFRFRTSAVDNANASYANQFVGASWNNTGFSVGSTGATSFPVPQFNTVSNFVRDVINPFATAQTDIVGMYLMNTDTGLWNGQFRNTTSFDGFSIIGTGLSGTISVYGYNK